MGGACALGQSNYTINFQKVVLKRLRKVDCGVFFTVYFLTRKEPVNLNDLDSHLGL